MSDDRYNDIDDFFHGSLGDFNPEPGDHVWGRLEKNLSHPLDQEFDEKNKDFQPEEPAWVWKSLSYLLAARRRAVLRRKIYASAGAIGILAFALLGIYQFHQVGEVLFAGRNTPSSGKPDVNIKLTHRSGHISGSQQPNFEFSPFTQLTKRIANSQIQKMDAIQPVLANNDQNDIHAEEPEFAENVDFLKVSYALRKIPMMVPVSLPFQMPWKNPSAKRWTRDKYFLGVSMGMGSSFRHLKGPDPTVQYRNQSERGGYAAQFQVKGGIRFGHFSISAGVGVVQFSENVSYTYQEKVHAVKEVMMKDVNKSKYFTVPVHYEKSTTKVLQAENRYQYIEFPMELGYTLQLGKTKLTPKVGASWAIRMQATGKTIMDRFGETIQIDLSKSAALIYAPTAVMGHGSLALELPINRKTSIELEPYVIRSLTNNMQNSEHQSQYFYNAGFRIGYLVSF